METNKNNNKVGLGKDLEIKILKGHQTLIHTQLVLKGIYSPIYVHI